MTAETTNIACMTSIIAAPFRFWAYTPARAVSFAEIVSLACG